MTGNASLLDVPEKVTDAFVADSLTRLLHGECTFDDVIDELLRIAEKDTGAQLVLYRRYDPKSDSLVLRKMRVAPDDSSVEALLQVAEIPREKLRGHGVGTELDFGVEQDVQNHPNLKLALAEGPYTEKERRFLRWIGREAWIQLEGLATDEGTVEKGIVIALRGIDALPFDPDAARNALNGIQACLKGALAVRQFYQRGHAERERMREISAVLPALAAVDSEAALWAGIARVLTSHKGLGWHRAVIFRSHESGAVADCVMAVGGVGEERWRDLHRELERKYDSLKAMVNDATRWPVPGQDSGDVDPLYELLVQKACLSYSVRYGGSIRKLLQPPDSSTSDEDQFLVLDDQDTWIQQLLRSNGDVARYLLSSGSLYAFPIRTPFEVDSPVPQVLGFVLLDMHYAGDAAFVEYPDVEFTRFVLDVLAQLVAVRMADQVFGQIANCVRSFEHEMPKMAGSLGRLRDLMGRELSGTAREQACELLDQLDLSAHNMERSYLTIHQAKRRMHGENIDLRDLLRGRAEVWNQQYPRLTVDCRLEKPDEAIAYAHPEMLVEACEAIVENANELAEELNEKVVLRVQRHWLHIPEYEPATIHHFAVIEFAAQSLTIPTQIERCVFLRGFSTHRADALARRGLGLVAARFKVSLWGGDLRIAACEPATFEIVLPANPRRC